MKEHNGKRPDTIIKFQTLEMGLIEKQDILRVRTREIDSAKNKKFDVKVFGRV